MSNSEMSSKLEEIPVSEILPLLFKVSHFLQQEFEYELSLYDLPKQLTGSRIRVLLEISEAGSLRMNELASRLGIKARTVTQFIDVLEAENYIKRLPDPIDRRATIIELSEEVKPIIKKIDKASKSILDKFMNILTEKERSELKKILLKLYFLGSQDKK